MRNPSNRKLRHLRSDVGEVYLVNTPYLNIGHRCISGKTYLYSGIQGLEPIYSPMQSVEPLSEFMDIFNHMAKRFKRSK